MDEGRDRTQRALDDLEREVVRATRQIEELRRESIALRRQLEALDRKPAGGRGAPLPEDWEEERRRWSGERQAIADRLRAILGKFQWLESEPTPSTSLEG
jgi:hypothetical protein